MLVLNNATLINGKAKKPIENQKVLVDGNRIADVGEGVRYPESAQVMDLKGYTILPGLIDLHVHCGGIVKLKPGEPNFVDMKASNKYQDAREYSIANGVTTLRSCGDFFPDTVIVRDELAAGRLSGPRFFVTGMQFTAPGGHPAYTIMSGDKYILEHSIKLADDPVKARADVRMLVDGGVDYIKAQLSSLDVWNYPRKVPKLSLKVLEAIIDEAHKCNRRVIVHSETPQDGFDAAKRGADSLEHFLVPGAGSAEVPEGLIEILVEQGTHVVPTMSITKLYSSHSPGPKRYAELEAIIKRFYEAGVNISTGTDAGAPDIQFGEAVHNDMECMVAAGMSPMDTIIATTGKAAENLGKQDELGTIEKGKLADMIVVAGNPAQHIGDAKNIKLVMKDGKIMVDKLGLSKK
jgi:imidazolonepropionase-like amidohydrolase